MRTYQEFPNDAKTAPTDTKRRDSQGQEQEYVTQIREYKLITPLFGGGVEPGYADPISVIRASEIRGQLRFWWRATRGGQLHKEVQELSNEQLLLDMRHREESIWGAASQLEKTNVSLVSIHIEISDKRKIREDHPFEIYQKDDNKEHNRTRPRRDSIAPAYVAFPLQPGDKDLQKLQGTEETKVVYTDVFFSLSISFPANLHNDINASLWAWETFGGIGGRTRRGFGAIYLINIVENEQPQNIDRTITEQKIRERLAMADICHGKWPENVPYLSQTMSLKIMKRESNAINAWHYLINKLKEFRQQRPETERLVRGRKQRKIGRNRWPEPDAIRKLAGQYYVDPYDNAHNHGTPIYNPPIDEHSFPRAVFGLPINFEFGRAYQHCEKPDPPGKNSLTPESYERFASPLVLRPIADNTDFYGLAVILEGTYVPERLSLAAKKGPYRVSYRLSKADASRLRKKDDKTPLLTSNNDTNADILKAFLNFL